MGVRFGCARVASQHACSAETAFTGVAGTGRS